jgi:tellurite resistance protein
MHTYPSNSPQAAARIVALALIANSEVKTSEWAVLKSMRVHEHLGLTTEEWHEVVGDLYIDLVGSSTSLSDVLGDARLTRQLLDHVDDPDLQRKVMRLCTGVINADGQVDEGESAFLLATLSQWELHPEEQELVEPLLYGLDFQVKHRRTLCP